MDLAKYYKQEKFNALEDVDLNTNLLIIQEITKKWFNAKPNNPDLILLKDAVLVVSILANKMNYEKSLYHRTIEEYRGDKLRAIERARKVEEELKTIKPKIQNL